MTDLKRRGSGIAELDGMGRIGLARPMRRVILAQKEDLKMKPLIARFIREDAGQDLVEYGLLLGLISAATVAIISELGTAIVGQFSRMKDLID